MSGIVGTNAGRGSGSIGTAASGATISASDPAIDTNPADGVGTQWANSTSGEFYVCTDATAGSNVWTNVGDGTGDIEPWNFPGESYGYAQGGASSNDVIDKWSFTAQANATDVGNLTSGRGGHGGSCTSSTYGYICGGQPSTANVDKYAFASDGNAVDANFDMSGVREMGAGSSSSTHGYTQAGGAASESLVNIIDKFSFSSDGNATDIGDVVQQRCRLAGHSSATYGYGSGGNTAGAGTPYYDNIEKHSFSSDGNSTDVGNLTVGRGSDGGGGSSATHGHTAGGYAGGSSNVIDRFSFSSDGNATDVGDLTVSVRHLAVASATSYGYAAMGYSNTVTIQRWSFSTTGNTADWADLTVARHQGTGNQV